MLNQLVVVGRIKGELSRREYADGSVKVSFRLDVPRNYKNEKGEYDSDLFYIELKGEMAENTYKYCHNGDIIGVKGRLENNKSKIEILAERVTFLSSKKDIEE